MNDKSISISVVASTKDVKSHHVEQSPIRHYFFVDEPHDGDNNDSLNPWICELTALYYMWKHDNADILGLEHYRRFFVENSKTYDSSKYTPIESDRITSILENYDAIVAYYQETINWPADKFLKRNKKYADYVYWLELASKHTPGFKQFAINLWSTNTLLICCNMFIANRDVICEYCQWLFPLIDDYIKHSHPLNDTNKRNIGYLVEFTFGCWLLFNKKKVYLHNHIRFNKSLTKLEEVEHTTVNRGIKV